MFVVISSAEPDRFIISQRVPDAQNSSFRDNDPFSYELAFSGPNRPHRLRRCQRIYRRPNIDLRRARGHLAGGDADRLTTWYSGWYNGLAKKHYLNIARSKELEHEVIVYCKANPQIRIIEAIDVMLKQERLSAGFK
ncbi:hypothetical protein [Bradyrhizobium sp. LM2.9]